MRAGSFDGISFTDQSGGSLINDRAIVGEMQERVLGTSNVRTFRTSLNTLGDGFVEAIDGGALVVAPALGNKIIYPFSDFLLHDGATLTRNEAILRHGG